ncbi:hypothetical protein MKW94_014171 [Papaver nudicaule]|uniref:NAC domain-containing protein n=1 Tax=Papaver nudicaule TaxID=74823 RepID=A0AA41SAA4_PAPNU|nr:hypothetical protein [Papaver nudicaule]
MRQRDAEAELNLPPGFRFHPTDEELMVHYLCRKVTHQALPVPIIAEVDLYRYDPWSLPDKSLFGTKEWYFFTPRDRKYPNGSRPNRTAGSGYWKATGADKPIKPLGHSNNVGIKKALVFYSGKAPRGIKTNWIMHEYRLAEEPNRLSQRNGSLRLDNWVLCRLYNKKNNWEMIQQEPRLQPIAEENTAMETGSDSFTSIESEVEDEFHSDDRSAVKKTWSGNACRKEPTTIAISRDSSTVVTESCFKLETVDEENDWFMGLSLDDLQKSLSEFESFS